MTHSKEALITTSRLFELVGNASAVGAFVFRKEQGIARSRALYGMPITEKAIADGAVRSIGWEEVEGVRAEGVITAGYSVAVIRTPTEILVGLTNIDGIQEDPDQNALVCTTIVNSLPKGEFNGKPLQAVAKELIRNPPQGVARTTVAPLQ